MFIGIAVGALIAVVGTLLVVRIGRHTVGEGVSASWLAVAFAVGSFATVSVLNFASLNYTMPVGWIVAIALAVIATAGLFVLTGRRVGWNIRAVLMLAGVFVASAIAFVGVAFTDMAGGVMQPLFAARAGQIAASQGFTALLPTDLEMDTMSGRPVDPLGAPDEGVWMSYGKFRLEERKAPGAADASALRALVAAGARPTDGVAIPGNAEYATLSVNGQPAVGVTFRNVSPEVQLGKAGSFSEPATLLVTVIDGTDVRLFSSGGEEWHPDGTTTPFDPLTLEELAKIAESLAPAD